MLFGLYLSLHPGLNLAYFLLSFRLDLLSDFIFFAIQPGNIRSGLVQFFHLFRLERQLLLHCLAFFGCFLRDRFSDLILQSLLFGLYLSLHPGLNLAYFLLSFRLDLFSDFIFFAIQPGNIRSGLVQFFHLFRLERQFLLHGLAFFGGFLRDRLSDLILQSLLFGLQLSLHSVLDVFLQGAFRLLQGRLFSCKVSEFFLILFMVLGHFVVEGLTKIVLNLVIKDFIDINLCAAVGASDSPLVVIGRHRSLLLTGASKTWALGRFSLCQRFGQILGFSHNLTRTVFAACRTVKSGRFAGPWTIWQHSPLPTHQRCFARILQGIEIQVDIERGPIQMKSVVQFNVENISNCRVLEPGKLIVRQEILLLVGVQPETMSADIEDLNPGSVFPKRFRFHLDVPL